MILPSVTAEDQRCTACRHPQDVHPPDGSCTDCAEYDESSWHPCLEWRNAPEDTVLACLLRALYLHRPGEAQAAEEWRRRLRALNIPADAPAVRWREDIARALASAGLFPDLPVPVAPLPASPESRNGIGGTR